MQQVVSIALAAAVKLRVVCSAFYRCAVMLAGEFKVALTRCKAMNPPPRFCWPKKFEFFIL